MFFFTRLVFYIAETGNLFIWSTMFGFKLNIIYLLIYFCQGVKIVFKVGLALLKYCHDDLVSIQGIFIYFRPLYDVTSNSISVFFFDRWNYPSRNSYTLCATFPRMQWIQIHYYRWLTQSRYTTILACSINSLSSKRWSLLWHVNHISQIWKFVFHDHLIAALSLVLHDMADMIQMPNWVFLFCLITR